MGVGDLNWHLHACRASILPKKPSPHSLSWYSLWFLLANGMQMQQPFLSCKVQRHLWAYSDLISRSFSYCARITWGWGQSVLRNWVAEPVPTPAYGWKTEEIPVAPDKWVLGPEGCCCCLNYLPGFTFSQSKLLSLSPQCQVGSTGPVGLEAACQWHWRGAQFSNSALLFLHVSHGHLGMVLGRVERIVTNRMCSFP